MEDSLNVIALGLATISVLSGFLAVGRRDWWDFGDSERCALPAFRGSVTRRVRTAFIRIKILAQHSWPKIKDNLRPYMQGNGRALLYLLVAITTGVSVLHVAILLDWLVSPTSDALGQERVLGRLVWHCLVASCMIGLHIWTRLHRKSREGQPDRYFWGSGDGGS